MRAGPGRRRSRGFTLIELLVVVAIIALLISILLPSLSQARQQASGAACAGHLHGIGIAMHMYQSEAKGYMPGNLWSEAAWSKQKQTLWFYNLFPMYIPDPKVLMCPGDPFRGQFDFDALNPKTNFLHNNHKAQSCGYGMNYLLRHLGEPWSYNIERFPPKRPLSYNILLAEVGPDHALEETDLYGVPNQFKPAMPWRDGGRLIWDDGARPWYVGPTWLTTRHSGGINVLAMDYSYKKVRTVEIAQKKIVSYYQNCASGDCFFCNYHSAPAPPDVPHYNFSHAGLYWWTGPWPKYP